MKLWKKILLALLALFVCLAVALAIWQRNNIQAAYTFLTQDSETIAENVEQKRQEHQDAIQAVAPITVAPPSTQQSDDLISGRVDPEQVKEELGIKEQLDKAGSEATAEELINSCVAELYGCKIDIMAVLAQLKQETLDIWLSLSDEERTSGKIKELGLAGLEKCYALEAEVDDQVREILNRYQEKLNEIGADASITATLWQYYSEEKAAEKAFYMDKYIR